MTETTGCPRAGAARLARWAGVALVCSLGWAMPGQAAENPPTQAGQFGAAAPGDAGPAEFRIGNRHIVTLRAINEFGADPAERRTGIEQRFAALRELGGPQVVTSELRDEAIAILLDGQMLLRVLPDDADREAGQTPRQVALTAVRNLELALAELREARDTRALAGAVGKTVLATLVLALALWVLVRAYGWLAARTRATVRRRSQRLAPAWGEEVVGHVDLAELVVLPVRLLAWAIALLLAYEWAALVLGFFPYTRPWGEALFENSARALGEFGTTALHAIPGLLFVALIFFVTRFVTRLVRTYFEAVHVGRVKVGWIDDATARPTGRLLIVVIWLFALVAAYPYVPGSDSEAFKGIGVFVGLMMSIGASGIVNQAVSGLMLMYTRALRPGDFVQIGENEGTVTAVGFLTTRIETLRKVEVNIPNAVIAGNVTRNFSRLAATNGGFRLATSVTIGYDTPWRQVQAMLQIAATRTGGVSAEPAPRVLQTALQDFYVEYTLLVCLPDPRSKNVVLDDLHGHIQDVFNEHGVQIMSPHYETDTATPKVVPREHWHAAPADAVIVPAKASALTE